MNRQQYIFSTFITVFRHSIQTFPAQKYEAALNGNSVEKSYFSMTESHSSHHFEKYSSQQKARASQRSETLAKAVFISFAAY